MVTHSGLKPFSCKICNSSFTQSGSLSAHLRKHDECKDWKVTNKINDEQVHLCPICGKMFKEAFSLTVHIRRHKGDKPYQCNQCDMRYVIPKFSLVSAQLEKVIILYNIQ